MKKTLRAVCCPNCKTYYVVKAYWFKYVNERCPLCGEITEYTTENTVLIK